MQLLMGRKTSPAYGAPGFWLQCSLAPCWGGTVLRPPAPLLSWEPGAQGSGDHRAQSHTRGRALPSEGAWVPPAPGLGGEGPTQNPVVPTCTPCLSRQPAPSTPLIPTLPHPPSPKPERKAQHRLGRGTRCPWGPQIRRTGAVMARDPAGPRACTDQVGLSPQLCLAEPSDHCPSIPPLGGREGW